jgi:hypothetical protein
MSGLSIEAMAGKKPAAYESFQKHEKLIKDGEDPAVVENQEIVEQLEHIEEESSEPASKAPTPPNIKKLVQQELQKEKENRRPSIDVTFDNEYIEFNFKAYEYHVLDFFVHMLVDVDSFQAMPKTEQDFTLTVDGETYPVIFLGKPVDFKTIDMAFITFMRERKQDDA